MEDNKPDKGAVKTSQVEKMLRSIQRKIDECEEALRALRIQKQACEVLLSPEKASAHFIGKTNRPRAKRTRQGIHQKLEEILKHSPEGLTVAELTQVVRQQGELSDAQRPEGTVYAALARHTELFERTNDGKWRLSIMS